MIDPEDCNPEDLPDTVGIRLHARAEAVQGKITGIHHKAHKKRLAAMRAAANNAALTSALPGLLKTSEDGEVKDVAQIKRVPYHGFVELESDDENEEDGGEEDGGEEDGGEEDLPFEFRAERLPRNFTYHLGEAGMRGVDRATRSVRRPWGVCAPPLEEEFRSFVDASKFEEDVRTSLPWLYGFSALQEEKLSAANAEMSAELEHLHAEKHVRDAELIALRANITLLKDVLRDACPLACIDKLDAWMDKK